MKKPHNIPLIDTNCKAPKCMKYLFSKAYLRLMALNTCPSDCTITLRQQSPLRVMHTVTRTQCYIQYSAQIFDLVWLFHPTMTGR